MNDDVIKMLMKKTKFRECDIRGIKLKKNFITK